MTIDSELLAGLIFAIFGGFAVILGWSYGFGSFSALGSGAVPVLAGVGLFALGGVQIVRAGAARRAGARLITAFPRGEMRPLLVILLSVLVFALLVRRVGFLPSLATLVAISWYAERGGRLVELAAVMAVVMILIVAIFYYGLGIPFRLVTWAF